MADTFKEIREIEKESDDIISGAATKKDQVIATARKEAERHFSEDFEALKQQIEQETNQAGIEAEAARQKVLNANRKKIDALKQASSANTEKAVQIVMKKFEGLFE